MVSRRMKETKTMSEQEKQRLGGTACQADIAGSV